MASNGLFCVYGCIPGLAFCSFLVISFRNSVSWDLHFFLCPYIFFYVLARTNSSCCSRCIFCCCGFGLDILIFLSLFLYSFVVLSALGARHGKCLLLHVFTTLFLFFLFIISVYFTVCFLHVSAGVVTNFRGVRCSVQLPFLSFFLVCTFA